LVLLWVEAFAPIIIPTICTIGYVKHTKSPNDGKEKTRNKETISKPHTSRATPWSAKIQVFHPMGKRHKAHGCGKTPHICRRKPSLAIHPEIHFGCNSSIDTLNICHPQHRQLIFIHMQAEMPGSHRQGVQSTIRLIALGNRCAPSPTTLQPLGKIQAGVVFLEVFTRDAFAFVHGIHVVQARKHTVQCSEDIGSVAGLTDGMHIADRETDAGGHAVEAR
jgi:hypothetical protein